MTWIDSTWCRTSSIACPNSVHAPRTLISASAAPLLSIANSSTSVAKIIPSSSAGNGAKKPRSPSKAVPPKETTSEKLPESNTMTQFALREHGLDVDEVHHNLAPSSLYEHAIRFAKDARIAEHGALVAYSGAKTGRSPTDTRVVKHPESEKDVWCGSVNIPCDANTFAINRQRALDYLNTRERLYCFDGFAGWDPKYRIKIRVICSRPYHALFMHTMLIRPTQEEF